MRRQKVRDELARNSWETYRCFRSFCLAVEKSTQLGWIIHWKYWEDGGHQRPHKDSIREKEEEETLENTNTPSCIICNLWTDTFSVAAFKLRSGITVAAFSVNLKEPRNYVWLIAIWQVRSKMLVLINLEVFCWSIYGVMIFCMTKCDHHVGSLDFKALNSMHVLSMSFSSWLNLCH